MRYISLFSGIEAASVAWEDLGWVAVAFSEIEPFPCELLKQRYPDVPNLGDITKIDWSEPPIVSYQDPPEFVVRKLMPIECERLQGFPDGWTEIEFKGKPASDAARYKALGNSMAVPVMRWIGERVQEVLSR